MSNINDKAKALRAEVSLTDFLSRLGHQPERLRSGGGMYLSMLRDSDSRPSFSVNEQLGVWYDHGMGRGGDVFDLARLYWPGLSFREAVDKVAEVLGVSVNGLARPVRPRTKPVTLVPNYLVEKVLPLGSSVAITAYLERRGVLAAAKGLMSEVHYYVQDEKGLRKHFFAAGHRNELDGWEVRNKYFKGCLGKKGLTWIEENAKRLAVFEGFFDFLSWRTEHPESDRSILVLNSLALLERGLKKAILYPDIEIYFDRDGPGRSAASKWMAALPYSTDKSSVFEGFVDYNDKLIAAAKSRNSDERMKR